LWIAGGEGVEREGRRDLKKGNALRDAVTQRKKTQDGSTMEAYKGSYLGKSVREGTSHLHQE